MMLSDEDLQRMSPFPIVGTPGARVMETWEELRQRPDVTPVMVGNRDSAEHVLQELAKDTGTAESVLEQALKLDCDAWLAERVRARPDHFSTDGIDLPWDGVERRLHLFVPSRDARGEPHAEVFFALVPAPASEPWRVATYMRTAGANDCPDAVVHTALCKRWYERYGAVITTIADGVFEFHVERPPTTMEAAHALALELFIYCPDDVHQGAITIGNLAGGVLNGKVWFFWWS
jgi:hypothetical protein